MNSGDEETAVPHRPAECRHGTPAEDALDVSPLLHIGFFKTASSWLQKYLFTPPFGYRHVVDAFALQSLLVNPSAVGSMQCQRGKDLCPWPGPAR